MSRVADILDTDTVDYLEPYFEDCSREDVIEYVIHLQGVIEDLKRSMEEVKKELVG